LIRTIENALYSYFSNVEANDHVSVDQAAGKTNIKKINMNKRTK